MVIPDIGAAGGAMLGAAIPVLGMLLHSLRKVSRHGVGMANDHAEKGMISRLQHERDIYAKRADEAEEEARREREGRTADREKIARLESRCEALTEANGRLTASVRRFAGTLPNDVRRLVVTDFADFDDRPVPRPKPPGP